ncbi:MAG: hypothetical protein CMA12_05245 [Euryarchaeota archaeon]|nr:hypothetical protein [Euryarchaeota archaeon]OUW22237.1 MAG: hypothetical protein CBD33_03110 [Euryarchaeota archaeon TMED173]|tara:strand:- start:200 stop:1108 length:909 start_codon:yes stop_codon:yes gene_type:complete
MDNLSDLDTRLLVDLLWDKAKPNKTLGQNFLIDDDVISRSVEIPGEFDSPLSEASHVLEIGPGPGSLTLSLLRKGARVSAIEIDKNSIEHLERVFGDRGCELSIKESDAVSVNWPEGITHVISNLPYQASSPIIDRITRYHSTSPISLSVLLVQEEFAHRMAMSSAPYDLGPLGLNLWLDFEIFVDRKVHPNSFSPSPKVKSRLVVLKPISRPEVQGINKRLFRIITRHCFSNRRKKMRTLLSKPPNRISRVSGWHRDRWSSAVSRLIESLSENIKEDWLNLRPENFEPSDWLSITREIERE